MRKIITALAAAALTLSMTACYTPGERAAGGAMLGAATGAAVGAASGAMVGAATAPSCPYGVYRDAYGNLYCR